MFPPLQNVQDGVVCLHLRFLLFLASHAAVFGRRGRGVAGGKGGGQGDGTNDDLILEFYVVTGTAGVRADDKLQTTHCKTIRRGFDVMKSLEVTVDSYCGCTNEEV